MKNIFLFLVLLLPAINSFACLNEYYAINAKGELIYLGESWKSERINKNHNQGKIAFELLILEKQIEKDKNYMLLSDYAVGLMKLGKAKEALGILKVLYKHYPAEYRIVANLGTAYELNGQADSALKYIRLDMKLNPQDHEGSEWIHVKILETKLALQKDPSWLKTHTVLQLTEEQKKRGNVQQHLLIQLHERVPFTPGPDALVGSLFVDLGDLTANSGTIPYARVYYRIAKEYYGVSDTLLDEKIEKMNVLIKKHVEAKPKYELATKVSNIKVEDILVEDSNWGNAVDPKRVNTNVNALLAMADYTKTPEQVEDSIDANREFFNNIEDSLRSKEDTLHQATGQEEKATAPEGKRKSVWPYPVAGGGVVVLVAAVIARRRRRKRK